MLFAVRKKKEEKKKILVTKKAKKRSHSVQLIKNTCDFLLKQLEMFFFQPSYMKA